MHADVGQAYHDAGLVREAITEYEKAVALCPQFADLQTKLGTLLREINDLAAARAHYESALQSKPNYVPARLQLGVILLSLGDANGAEEHWKAVIGLEPDNSQAKMYLRMLERTRSQVPPADG
jgi:tetratricopeptide (TPR) repeat protein